MKPTLHVTTALLCLLLVVTVDAQTCMGSTFTPPTTPTNCAYTYTNTGATGWQDGSGNDIAGPPIMGTGINITTNICVLADLNYDFAALKNNTFYVAPGVTFTGDAEAIKGTQIIEGTAVWNSTPNTGGTKLWIYPSGSITLPETINVSSSDVVHNAGIFNVGIVNTSPTPNVIADLDVSSNFWSYSDSLTVVTGDSAVSGDYNNCGLFEIKGDLQINGTGSNFNNDCATYLHGTMHISGDYTNVGLMYFEGNVNLVGPTIFYNEGTLVFYDLVLTNDDIVGIGDEAVIIARNTAILTNGATVTDSYFFNSSASPPPGGGFNSICGSCSATNVDILINALVPTTPEEVLADCGENIIPFGPHPIATLDFDGVDDYLTTTEFIDGLSQVSIMGWVKSDTGNTTNMTIAGEDTGCKLWLQNGNKPTFTIKPNLLPEVTISDPSTINLNEWHHIAGIYTNATGQLQLFVDGVLVNSGTTSIPGAVIANTGSSNNKFEIGRRSTGAGSEYFKGDIDEVRVFNTAITADQLQRMVYQEIQNTGGNVRGTVIPKDIVDITTNTTIPWTNLIAYYPMTDIISYTRTTDYSSINRKTYLKNIETIVEQTAPMPYETKADGAWTTEGTWLHGDVWDIEDVANNKDCSIVEIKHDVSTTGSHTNLGLIVDSTKTLTVNGGNEIKNTWYLQLHGKIDLQGESQLVQGIYSELDVTSAGIIEQDQQGTADKFTYNYWSSPVGVSNTTTNNNSYALANVFKDGTNAAAPASISFLASGYNGSPGPPLKLADYWIWKFANAPSGQYSQWQHTRSTGNIKAGEGFTMKGPGSGNILDNQNYVFQGKPNNGLIELDIAIGNDYLIGNPYPCALDANQFITDNAAVIVGENSADGTLYFWEHWGGGTHNLSEYQGGYAMYNLSGATPTASMGSTHPEVGSGGAPTKTPGRYIPVGQGFFVTGNVSGKIKFNNGQRVFHKESSGNSTFMKSSNSKGKNKDVASGAENETRLQIRIGFNSVSTYRRQLLLTEDANATVGVDKLYDARIWDFIPDDMYWVINDQWFGIQGIDEVTTETILPIGIHTVKAGVNTITIDELINVPESLEIYVYDKEDDSYHDLRKSDYQVDLMANTASTDRFKIVLKKQETIVEEEVIVAEEEIVAKEDIGGVKPQLHYDNEKGSITFNNPELKKVNSIAIYNVSGQLIKKFNDVPKKNNLELEIKRSPGIYILTAKMENETSISKNVIIK